MMRFNNTGYKWVSEWPGEQKWIFQFLAERLKLKLNPFCDEYELTTVHMIA